MSHSEFGSDGYSLKYEVSSGVCEEGSPLVILSKDGELYLPISDKMPDEDQRQKLPPFLGKYVRANGRIYQRKGTHAHCD